MTLRIAITGHRGLSPDVERRIDADLRAALNRLDDGVVAVSCLADGADTIFAKAVLDGGGQLEVVVPAAKYRNGLPAEHWPVYDLLIKRADRVYELERVESTSEAHMEASARMIELADELWAVWDGLPARGYGGTADVVEAAHTAGLQVRVFWPDGAAR
ncbi:hypothetical protein [Nonomuraea sp. NPDC003754]